MGENTKQIRRKTNIKNKQTQKGWVIKNSKYKTNQKKTRDTKHIKPKLANDKTKNNNNTHTQHNTQNKQPKNNNTKRTTKTQNTNQQKEKKQKHWIKMGETKM